MINERNDGIIAMHGDIIKCVLELMRSFICCWSSSSQISATSRSQTSQTLRAFSYEPKGSGHSSINPFGYSYVFVPVHFPSRPCNEHVLRFSGTVQSSVEEVKNTGVTEEFLLII
jgi:hypothetical protein